MGVGAFQTARSRGRELREAMSREVATPPLHKAFERLIRSAILNDFEACCFVIGGAPERSERPRSASLRYG